MKVSGIDTIRIEEFPNLLFIEIKNFLLPKFTNFSIICSKTVLPAKGINGFGSMFVKGISLVPLPPAIITTEVPINLIILLIVLIVMNPKPSF